MSAPAEPRPAKHSEARERLLTAASKLFYAEGIGSVGVNRIVSTSQVTLATFYRHFPGKEDLVVAYLRGVHDAVGERAASVTDGLRGHDLVRAVGQEVIAQTALPGFRGCAFINAASEFEDPDSPVRRVVAEHRRWYYALVRRGFEQAGHGLPGNAARHFLMLRDGAMTAGHLDDPAVARRTFARGIEGLMRSVDLEPAAPHEDADDGHQGPAPLP